MFFKELVHQKPGKLTNINFNLAEKTFMTQSISLKWKESCIKTYLYVFSHFVHFTDVFPNPAQLLFFFLSLPETQKQLPFHFLGILISCIGRVARVSLSCTPHWTFLREGPGKDSSTNSSSSIFWVISKMANDAKLAAIQGLPLYRLYILCPVNG